VSCHFRIVAIKDKYNKKAILSQALSLGKATERIIGY